MRVSDMVVTRQLREDPTIADDASDRYAAEADAMVAAFATDQSRPGPLSDGSLIGQGDLERGIDGFRSRSGEEDAVQAARSDRCEFVRKIEGDRVTHLKRGRVIQRHQLPFHGVCDLLATVPGVHAPKTSRPVDDLSTVAAGVVHAFRRA